jgi:hypothetical protein
MQNPPSVRGIAAPLVGCSSSMPTFYYIFNDCRISRQCPSAAQFPALVVTAGGSPSIRTVSKLTGIAS